MRYVPGELARALVTAGSAVVSNRNGKVRTIKLTASAATHGVRIGEPSDGWLAPRFSVRERLDGGGIVWKHHPRCTSG